MTTTPSNHRRLVTLFVVLVFIATGAWAWHRSVRPRPGAEPPGPPLSQAEDELVAEKARAEKCPEYTELRDRGSHRQLTDRDVTRVLELSRHPNYWIRLTALGITTSFPANHRSVAVERLVEALRDANLHVRLCAIRHLGVLDARERIPDLLPFLTSDSEDERQVAKHVLRRLGHPVE